jgi:branched-subunit amino acid permease
MRLFRVVYRSVGLDHLYSSEPVLLVLFPLSRVLICLKDVGSWWQINGRMVKGRLDLDLTLRQFECTSQAS